MVNLLQLVPDSDPIKIISSILIIGGFVGVIIYGFFFYERRNRNFYAQETGRDDWHNLTPLERARWRLRYKEECEFLKADKIHRS